MTSLGHLQRLSLLTKQEWDYEQETFYKHLADTRISGRISEAGCHYPIELKQSDFNALNQLILTVTFEQDDTDLENDFEPGKAVQFFYVPDNGDKAVRLPQTFFVEQVGVGALLVSIPDKRQLARLRDLSKQHLLGIQIGIDNTSYQVMTDALRQAMTSTDERFVHLRETLIGPLTPSFRQHPRLLFSWLNATQNDAIQQVVEAREVAVIHGPPGTGKTTTLTEAIIETLRHETQVMVCAPSNAAVDWLSEQLMRRGVPVLRIGNPLRMSDEMLDCSYERRYANHPDYIELWNIRRALRAVGEKGQRADHARLKKMHDQQIELEIKINDDLFNQARVVSCTLIGSAYQIMQRRRFSTLFIDEAAQALEPACWAAIGKCDRVIFAGDHQQLPPTVKSPEALRGGLGDTLMQHIVNAKPCCVTLLTTQYRMNRDIMDFSSRWFYDGHLSAAPEVAERAVSLTDYPLTWIDTCRLNFQERQNSHTPSLMNAEEARLLIQTLRDYVESIGLQRFIDDHIDIGIISPYRSQVRLLRKMFRSQRLLHPLRRQVSIHTIDGFQGQERDVIMISIVRDNTQHAIGFLRDLRRMNVALTRARMKLIVVGNSETLSQHPFYRQLIKHFADRGEIVQLQPDGGAEPPDDNPPSQTRAYNAEMGNKRQARPLIN